MKYSTTDRLGDAELVATILGKRAVDDECHQLAIALFKQTAIGRDELSTICQETSIAAQRVRRIEAAIELGRRSMAARAARKMSIISTPEEVAELIGPHVIGLERETFWSICLDTKNHVKRFDQISVGSLNASIVHPREVYTMAVRISAASVIIAHNHPSGDPTPSGADIALTRRLMKAGDTIGIELLDHVVLGGDGYVSMRDEGLM